MHMCNDTHTHSFQLHQGGQDGACRGLECKGNREKKKNMFLFPARGNECVTQRFGLLNNNKYFLEAAVKKGLSFKVALKKYFSNYCGNTRVFLKK